MRYCVRTYVTRETDEGPRWGTKVNGRPLTGERQSQEKAEEYGRWYAETQLGAQPREITFRGVCHPTYEQTMVETHVQNDGDRL